MVIVNHSKEVIQTDRDIVVADFADFASFCRYFRVVKDIPMVVEEAIARIIRQATYQSTEMITVDQDMLIDAFCNYLSLDNPKFDETKFRATCKPDFQ